MNACAVFVESWTFTPSGHRTGTPISSAARVTADRVAIRDAAAVLPLHTCSVAAAVEFATNRAHTYAGAVVIVVSAVVTQRVALKPTRVPIAIYATTLFQDARFKFIEISLPPRMIRPHLTEWFSILRPHAPPK